MWLADLRERPGVEITRGIENDYSRLAESRATAKTRKLDESLFGTEAVFFFEISTCRFATKELCGLHRAVPFERSPESAGNSIPITRVY